MAKQEHIELLQQGKDKWNAWRAEHQDVYIFIQPIEDHRKVNPISRQLIYSLRPAQNTFHTKNAL